MVPYEVAGKTSTSVQLVYQGIPSDAVTYDVVPFAPGIYTQDGAGMGAGEAFSPSRVGVNLGPKNTEVRRCLRAIIEPEDGLYRTVELGGQKDAAFTDTIGISVESLLHEADAEGFLHSSDGPAELDRASLRFRCVFSDGEPELFRESAHQLDGGRIGGVLPAILCACDAIFAQALGIEGVLRRMMTETVIELPGGAGFSPVAAVKGAFSLPGRTTRFWEERRGVAFLVAIYGVLRVDKVCLGSLDDQRN